MASSMVFQYGASLRSFTRASGWDWETDESFSAWGFGVSVWKHLQHREPRRSTVMRGETEKPRTLRVGASIKSSLPGNPVPTRKKWMFPQVPAISCVKDRLPYWNSIFVSAWLFKVEVTYGVSQRQRFEAQESQTP